MASVATETRQSLVNTVATVSSTSSMALGTQSTSKMGVQVSAKARSASSASSSMTKMRIMGLGGRGPRTPVSPVGDLSEELSAGFLTTDETDLGSESTSSSSSSKGTRSHDDFVVLRESQPVPTNIVDHSGCLKVPTQLMSLACQYGENRRQTSPSTSSKSLSWNTIEIATHEVILGDNPSVTLGPPLSLGWEVWEKISLPLEEYEAYRPERRSALNLRMSRSERERLLMQEFGVSRSHIREVTEIVNKIRLRRNASAKKTLAEALKDCFNSRRSVMRRNIQERP